MILMMKHKFDIATIKDGKLHLVSIVGDTFDVRGEQFAIHESRHMPGTYCVSHVETGFAVRDIVEHDEKSARRQFDEKVKHLSDEDFYKLIQSARQNRRNLFRKYLLNEQV